MSWGAICGCCVLSCCSAVFCFFLDPPSKNGTTSPKRQNCTLFFRRESSGGMEWLGVWNCIFSGSEFSNFGAWNLAKIALSAEFQGFSSKFRPLKNIFRTLENDHSIRHQSIPPLSAGRFLALQHRNHFSKKNLLPFMFRVSIRAFGFIRTSFWALPNNLQNESGRAKRYKNWYFGWPTGRSNKAVLSFYVFGFSLGRSCASFCTYGGFWVVPVEPHRNAVGALKIRVWALSLVSVKGTFRTGNRALKNGAGVGFDSGAAMLYNMKAPLLNPRTVFARNAISHLILYIAANQNRGGKWFFWVISVVEFYFEIGPRFCTHESKIRPRFWSLQHIHIYIYIYKYRHAVVFNFEAPFLALKNAPSY